MINNLIKKYHKSKKRKGGFSLVEMLIVLIVVALLMAIIIPNVAGQRDRINDQARENMADIITNQVETYRLVNGNNSQVTLELLVTEQYITAKQSDQAEKLLGMQPGTIIELPITITETQPAVSNE